MTNLTVSKSFSEKIGINILPADESMHHTNQLTAIIRKTGPISIIERDYLEQCLMRFDPANIRTKENHFGLWTAICFKLFKGNIE